MKETTVDYSAMQRFVRVVNIREDSLVEFEFSIDDPTLYVELVLPYPQFRKFCNRNATKELTHEQETLVDLDKLKWRFGETNPQ